MMLRALHANDVVPVGANEKILRTKFLGFFGWGTRILNLSSLRSFATCAEYTNKYFLAIILRL
jgi:hypothetical protein